MKHNKILTSVLIPIMMLSSFSCKTYAAPPRVTIDEAVYINLDYYGIPKETSIVKGCNLNGNTQFTDFGAYEKVTNMSNQVLPEINEDSVTWILPENTDRFYYECTPKENTTVIPWNIDVSYKINGVPTEAAELAGKSGLIEISVHCIPNDNCTEYQKNNMLLQVASTFSMDDTKSVEAPGAQVQSVGNYKAVIFAALPGEEKTFVMRIGTECFETSGIIMLMIPGTLEQLKNIKDLKEAKDKIKDSGDAVHESLEEILDVIENMNQGIISTKEGLNKLNEARNHINQNKNSVYENADDMLSALTSVSEQMSALIPHFENAQNMINDLNSDVNTLINTITKTKEDIDSFSDSITQLQKNAEQFQKMLSDFDETKEERKEIVEKMSNNFKDLTKNLDALKIDLGRMTDDTADLKTSVTSFRNSLSPFHISMSSKVIESDPSLELLPEGQLTEMLKLLDSAINTKLIAMISGINETLYTVNDYINNIYNESEDIVSDLADMLDSTEGSLATLTMICTRGQELSDSLRQSLDLADKYFTIIDDNYENADEFIEEMKILGDTTKNIFDTSKEIIDDADNLRNTMNEYKDSSILAVQDAEELTKQITQATESTTNFLSSLKEFLKSSGEILNAGTERTLDGLTDILENSLDGIKTAPVLRNANNIIKDTIDDEINKFEDENNFLNLDSEAQAVSFTSEKNPSPASIQIILRTEEINLESEEDKELDFEIESEDSGVWNRILNIFKKIWTAILSIFE